MNCVFRSAGDLLASAGMCATYTLLISVTSSILGLLSANGSIKSCNGLEQHLGR